MTVRPNFDGGLWLGTMGRYYNTTFEVGLWTAEQPAVAGMIGASVGAQSANMFRNTADQP